MDIGDWVFIGMIVISGIASVSKAAKKKTAGQSSGEQASTSQDKSDADEWIKKIIRESTKGLLDDDDFIPKNDAKPTVERPVQQKPLPSDDYRKGTGEPAKPEVAQPYANAELYRRNNQSLEERQRPRVSLENTTVVEGKVSHTGLRASMQTAQTAPLYDQALLDPSEDFSDTDEVRKALIYGEIMRTKF